VKSKAKKSIAIGTIILVVAGVFLIWFATDRANHHYGPSKIRVTEQGEIWVLSDGKLHVFDASGGKQRVLRFADWKRAELQSDFYPLQDGDVLLAEPDSHEIYRCTSGASCAPLLAVSRAKAGKTTNAMMLAVDENRQRLYVADNAGHRLLLLDLEGNLLDDSGKSKSRFWYPNHLMFSGGELLVTDTNHKRIVRVPVRDDRFGGETWTLHTAAAEVRPKRKWPMSFVALPDGGWWVAIAQEGMRNADVAMFDAKKLPQGHLPLENNADPVSLALAGDRVLMADTEHYRIRQVDLHGKPLEDFGPAPFRQELANLAHEADNWRSARMAGQAMVLVVPLLAILILWRLGERPITLPVALNFEAETRPIPAGEIVWLYPITKYLAMLNWMLRGLAVLAVGMGVCGIWLAMKLGAQFGHLGWLVGVLALLAVFPLFILLIPMRRLMRSRLGTDGVNLFHDKGDGKVYSFPLTQTLSDGFQLLAGRRLIPVRARNRMIYDRAELEGWLLSRLGPGAQLSPWNLFVAGLRNGNHIVWANVLAILMVVLGMIAVRLTGFSWQKFIGFWLG
jgi:hypothetical protein